VRADDDDVGLDLGGELDELAYRLAARRWMPTGMPCRAVLMVAFSST